MVDFAGTAAALAIFWILYLRAGRQDPIPSSHGIVLKYPASVAAVAWLFSWGLVLLLVVLAMLPSNRDPGTLGRAAAGFALIVVPAMGFWCETRRRVVLVTRTALVQVRRRGRHKKIHWKSVTRVTHNPWLGGYSISAPGTSLFVSDWLCGQREFAQYVLEQAVPTSLECREWLERAAALEQR